MADSKERVIAPFDGYHRKQVGAPDMQLCSVGRGTSGGEYLRRYWHPIAYLSELNELPLRVRALGEDLVAFKDGRGRVGVLHLRCCHRNTSLEFGIIEECGIRCCYHGRVFDVDGTVLEIPGDPAAEKLKQEVSQGGYPTHVFAGIVFVYMGPPEDIPVFPMVDRFSIPGVKLVPGIRLELDCNWIQIKENVLDPHHTNVLHVIPKLRGMDHFADEFGDFPEITFFKTPGGHAYLASRIVHENLWVRSAEHFGPNIHMISSIFEDGEHPKPATKPFLTFWTLPVDDDKSINFFISHVADDETLSFEERRRLEVFGQYEDRPYEERQYLPGDHDAQVGQGSINVFELEHLGTFDRGVALFRRYVRQGIKAVERGQTPQGFYRSADEIPPTFANDRIVEMASLDFDVTNADELTSYMERVAEDYLANPPMKYLTE